MWRPVNKTYLCKKIPQLGRRSITASERINLLKITGHVMHHQFNIQQL